MVMLLAAIGCQKFPVLIEAGGPEHQDDGRLVLMAKVIYKQLEASSLLFARVGYCSAIGYFPGSSVRVTSAG